ncbi:hypothetical protein AYO21_03322 [Fonsecaea monophora]|uniref:Uncharacterized protein n=1 Tax=Fonsecaea monophora TaxID=254056 RepID=A0A177FF93_9EURO|nr:hypothetical protein AYO21_03322 [Fonsecaea monophora]KAH0842963.1 hypothetical protein FOPE_08145 [Fonsecaea pedrosoi]OAG42446.1 hypothetical protein AYO21_03322 [Fonsecaea monophora]
MEKGEPDARPTPGGVSWRDNNDGLPVVDPEKEILAEQERAEQPDTSDTPDSGTTLEHPSVGLEEKPDLELPPAADSDTPARATRPELHDRATTYASSSRTLPRLKRKETRMMQKEAHPMQHLGITLGLPAILIFDIVVPCIIYYTWYNSHKHRWERECREQFNSAPGECPLPKPEYDENILGYAIISFGVGELWILIARVYRLFVHTAECAPLLSRSKWELDATSWVYGVAMILALIPFVVGSSLVLPHLYLYSPTFIMGFLGILMLLTEILPINIPIGINSQPRGTKLRPFIYYAAEDFIAVDGLQDREFRVRYNDRYENNKAFRNLFRYLTWWWLLGVCTYIGCVSAVIWTLEFHYAFGLSLGVLFAYIAIWAAVSYVWVRLEIEREHKAFEEGKCEA